MKLKSVLLIMSLFSLAAASGIEERKPEVTHWNQEIAGTYTGTLFASGYDMPVVTTFYYENEVLYGEYVMDEDGTMSPGQLADIVFTQGHTIECRWIDRYGTGSASFTFTADVSGFAGFWNTDEGTDEFTWWGSKHPMDAEEQNSVDLQTVTRKEITAKSMLHHHERTFATNWDANIYRGCQHSCRYCIPQYSPVFT